MNRDIFGCPISRPVSNVKTIKKIKKKKLWWPWCHMVGSFTFIQQAMFTVESRQMFTSRGQEDPRAASHRNLFNKRKAVPHIVQQDLPFCGCELIHLRPRQAEILLTVGRLGMCKTDIYKYPILYIYTSKSINVQWFTLIYKAFLKVPAFWVPNLDPATSDAGGPRWVCSICKFLCLSKDISPRRWSSMSFKPAACQMSNVRRVQA